MNAMREAQQAWDNMLPPDTSRQEREREQACQAALARYLKTGDLPGREDASHVWDELEDDEAGGIVLFDMLEAYRADNDTELLALAKRVAARVDGIVNEKIEDRGCGMSKPALNSDYERLQAECEKLRAAIRRLCNIYVVDDYYEGLLRDERLEAAVNRAINAVMETTP